MTDETERLEVAKKELREAVMMLWGCAPSEHNHSVSDCVHCENCVVHGIAILSRRDALMKKRGAVEELRKLDKKLPKDIESLKAVAEKTDNPQMKRAIEERLKRISKDNTLSK